MLKMKPGVAKCNLFGNRKLQRNNVTNLILLVLLFLVRQITTNLGA